MAKAATASKGRKLSKKELREDKLVQTAYKIEQFYHQNQNRVLGVVVVVLVIIVGGFLLQRMTSQSSLEKSYDLTLAKMAYGQQQYDQARAGLQQVVDKYSGVTAAEAKYYIARIDFDQGQFAAAEQGFREYTQNFKGDEYVNCAAEAGLAASLEAQGKTGEAAEVYASVAQKYGKLPYATEALLAAGRIYLDLNQSDKAKEALDKIIRDYPASTAVPPAKKLLESVQ